MKHFRFSLQAVLTVRLNQESKALEAFASAQTECQRIGARYQRIQDEIEQVFGLRRTVFRKAASSENLQQMQQGLRALQETERRCLAELQEAQANRDEKSKVLLEARQKREVVEKIQQKQRASFDVQMVRAEQKAADEFATLKSIGSLASKWR